MGALTTAIQNSMKTASAASGNNIDYVVSYDSTTKKFVFKENGTVLNELRFLWATGSNNKTNAASALGFDPLDDAELFGNESDDSPVNITIDATNNMIDFKELIGHDSDGEHIVILSVVVHPPYQGKGMAGKLMNNFIDRMKVLGKADIYLICQTELIEMYAKYGFVDLGP